MENEYYELVLKIRENSPMSNECKKQLLGSLKSTNFSEISDSILSYINEFTLRDQLVKKYSYAIPNEEALKIIAELTPIIEIGAGTGYWADLLRRDYGIDIICYDKLETKDRYGFNTLWTKIEVGGPEVLKNYPENRNLFLCWPPYDEPMAYECIKTFKGKYIIYIGEGNGGCTGEDNFHEYLENKFEEIKYIKIPQWKGINDFLGIYERKPSLSMKVRRLFASTK